MARNSGPVRASVRPSEAQAGGSIGFPSGAVVTITDAEWTTWQEAGETALKGGREADDPALKITGGVEDKDDPVTEFLGAGKAKKFQPSKDGQYLEPVSGMAGEALSDSCNATVFFNSVFMKDKKSEAYKRHKDSALPEDLLDEGVGPALIGMKFVAGRELVQRDFGDDRASDKKPRPTLVAAQILEGPGESKGKGKARPTSKRTKDEDEEEEAPRRGRSKKDEDEDDIDHSPKTKKQIAEDDDPEAAIEEAAEGAVAEVLEKPKYRKGLPVDDAFNAVYNVVKGDKYQKQIGALMEDVKWLKGKARPWKVDEDVIVSA